MRVDTIIPPGRMEIPPKSHVIFLEGPIQGTPDWQADAIRMIKDTSVRLRVDSCDSRIIIASPRRPIFRSEAEFTEDMYNEQVDWETLHRRRARQRGVILVWLAQSEQLSFWRRGAVAWQILMGRSVRPHAQTTRFELGEDKECAMRDGTNLVVGIEDGFSNGRYIKRRLNQDCPHVLTLRSLEAMCVAAVYMCVD